MAETRADRVYMQTEKRLSLILSGDEGVVRGQLASLRKGAGRKPGDDPKTWGILFSQLPEDMLGRYGFPSKEEWAIHTALTLFAVHQQGNDPKGKNMNQPGISLGLAAAKLVMIECGDDLSRIAEARERVGRRFHQIVLASDMDAMSYYLRGFITLLRSNEIGLDYPMLAKDIYRYQLPGGDASVRLKWGQDFYRVEKKDETSGKDE